MLVGVLALGAGLRGVFVVGPAASDDVRYMKAAESVACGETQHTLDHGCVRAAFIVWLALWVKLGAGTTALVFSDVVLSVAIMLALYRLARRWVSVGAALVALLWLACFPLELLCSGLVVSDHLGLLFALLSVGFATDAFTAEPGRGRGPLIAAAALTGLAVSAREVYVVLPVVLGAWVLWQIRPLGRAGTRWLVYGMLSVAVFSLEHLFFWWWTGDPAYRYHAVSHVYDAYPPIAGLGWRDLAYYPIQFLARPEISGAIGWMMLAAVLTAGGRLRDRRLIIIWTVCFFVFMQYGSTSFTRYQPLPKQWRYMLPMVILLFVPLGYWTVGLYRSPAVGRLATVLLMFGIAASGVFSANQRAAERLYSEDALRCLAAVSRDGPASGVALPDWLARGTALELSDQIRGWPIVDLSDGLQPAEVAALENAGSPLLVPEIMWHHKRSDAPYVQARSELLRRARTEPIEDWRSPLDRAASRIGWLRPHARKTVVGHYYWLTERVTRR